MTELCQSVLIPHDAKQTEYLKETNNDLNHNQGHNNVVEPRAVAKEAAEQHSRGRTQSSSTGVWCQLMASPFG